MKAFIIHTHHSDSLVYAHKTLESFEGFEGWEPQFFTGYTPATAPSIPIRECSRAATLPLTMRDTKRACSMNHRALFKLCVDLGEPIAVVEHDSQCLAAWNEPEWDDILVLNINAAIDRSWTRKYNYKKAEPGIHDIDVDVYRHDPEINGAKTMLGTAAYAVTPQGAAKMLKAYEDGWEQSDFIINTHYVRIQTLVPGLFGFHSENLQMSWGEQA